MEPRTIQKDVTEVIEDDGTGGSSFDVDASQVEADTLLGTLDEYASAFDVTGFKCTSCGLAHSHDTVKHQASETFALGAQEAASVMEYNSVCHCGLHELARRGGDLGVDQRRADSLKDGAPIPDEEAVRMNERFA